MRESLLACVCGLALRVAVPVFVTLGLGHLIERWLHLPLPDEVAPEKALHQWESARARNEALHCWDIRKCPIEMRNVCPAFLRPELPCWQVILEVEGRLRPGCLSCKLYPLAQAV